MYTAYTEGGWTVSKLRAFGIAWLATAVFSIVISLIFRADQATGFIVTLVLGIGAAALGAWLIARPSARAVVPSVTLGVAWLVAYGTLAVIQGGEARITNVFLATAGTIFGGAAWATRDRRASSEPPDIKGSDLLAGPGRGWLRLAATLYIFLGLAFALSVPFVLAFYMDNGYLPTIGPFQALAGGPFEELDRTAFLAAGLGLVAASAVAVAAGLLLWRGRSLGVRLGLLIDPLAFVLGLGFALPLLVIGVPLRASLVLIGVLRTPRTEGRAAEPRRW